MFLGTVYGGFELQTRALYEVGHVVSTRLKRVSIGGFRLFVATYATFFSFGQDLTFLSNLCMAPRARV